MIIVKENLTIDVTEFISLYRSDIDLKNRINHINYVQNTVDGVVNHTVNIDVKADWSPTDDSNLNAIFGQLVGYDLIEIVKRKYNGHRKEGTAYYNNTRAGFVVEYIQSGNSLDVLNKIQYLEDLWINVTTKVQQGDWQSAVIDFISIPLDEYFTQEIKDYHSSIMFEYINENY